MGVSVVIPTTLRPSLRDAIESVANQTVGRQSVEIIVVADVAESTPIPKSLSSLVDQLIVTGGALGGGASRQMGVRAATESSIAFLDDDDIWLPQKLEAQLPHLARNGPRTVVSCQVLQYGDGLSERVVPEKVIAPEQNIQDYLFRRRRASIGRASMFTSSVLTSRELLLEVEWDPALRRHQDWDWLVRVGREKQVRFVQLEYPLLRYWTGSAGSISASANWKDSLTWFDAISKEWDPRTAVDFLAAQPLRYALQARSFRGVLSVSKRAAARRRLPSVSCLAIGMGGLLGRARLQRAMHATGHSVNEGP